MFCHKLLPYLLLRIFYRPTRTNFVLRCTGDRIQRIGCQPVCTAIQEVERHPALTRIRLSGYICCRLDTSSTGRYFYSLSAILIPIRSASSVFISMKECPGNLVQSLGCLVSHGACIVMIQDTACHRLIRRLCIRKFHGRNVLDRVAETKSPGELSDMHDRCARDEPQRYKATAEPLPATSSLSRRAWLIPAKEGVTEATSSITCAEVRCGCG